MKRAVWMWLAAVVLIGIAAHAATIHIAPRYLMDTAYGRLSGEGQAINQMVFLPRIGPQSRGVVRPSPDLAYASCAYDLSNGPVRVRIARGTGYQSLSLFAENTDNFYTLNDRQMGPEGAEVVIIRAGQTPPPGDAIVVSSPSVRGLALDRRLAPTAEAFAEADQVRRAGVCEAVG